MDRTSSLAITALLSVLLLALGTIGYMLIEGWGLIDSLYMTVITLATVGYGEVHEVSQPGRLFTVILIVLGVGFFLYVVGNIIQFLVEGRIRIILGRRKLDKQINELKNHYIICGYGRIGRVLCRYLFQRNLDVVVIEKDQERISILDQDDILYVVGEATDEANLAKAGIDRAKGLITALGTDAENVFLLLTARQLNPELYVVARASQNVTKKTLTAAGANMVVSPYDVGARRMAHAILRPSVIDFLELAFADESTDINIEEIPVSASSKLIDRTLKDSGIRQDFNLIILAAKKADGSMLFNPTAESKIALDDTLIAVGERKNLAKLEKILNP
ncbi:MAG: potassium channel protein [Desulfobacteraceae bacterium]